MREAHFSGSGPRRGKKADPRERERERERVWI